MTNIELTLSNFFFKIPIYTPIEIDDSNRGIFGDILDVGKPQRQIDGLPFEGYNPTLRQESTFHISQGPLEKYFIHSPSDLIISLRDMQKNQTIIIQCRRSNQHFHFYIHWDNKNSILTKTGQSTSLADFQIHDIKQYKKILPEEKMKEFTKAIGLAAHGVGIGSFVYLRRIFEHLIDIAYQKAKTDGSVDAESFNKLRMTDKIEGLSGYLPEFLVEHKGLYSILSIGIHELDEATCLKHFDTVKIAIELILDEKLDALKKQEKIAAATKNLQQTHSALKA